MHQFCPEVHHEFDEKWANNEDQYQADFRPLYAEKLYLEITYFLPPNTSFLMPNRMLRDWTNSEKIAKLSAEAEVFFTRLIMKCDDFGCFYGDSRLLRANLFPLQMEKVKDRHVLKWFSEILNAGLIISYESDGKQYIQIQDFRQRLDKAKSRFPKPIFPELVNEFPEVVNEFPEVVNEFPAEVEEKKNRIEGNADNIFFQMMRRAAGSHIPDCELKQEVGKFRNKYPNIHPNRAGPLVNTWVTNIGREITPVKKMVI